MIRDILMNEGIGLDLLSSFFEHLIPEGTDTAFMSGDTKICVQKKDGQLHIEAISSSDNTDSKCEHKKCEKSAATKFDDSKVKCEIGHFKDAIKHMDDELFADFIEDLGSIFNLSHLCALMDLDCFTEQQATEAFNIMAGFNAKFEQYIQESLDFFNDEKSKYFKALKG